MKLSNEFEVPAPLDEAWALLNDLECVALCMPGARLDSIDGDKFTGSMKLKLGALTAQFRGSGVIAERDSDEHRVAIEAKGKDGNGTGTAQVSVSVALRAENATRTKVSVEGELNVSGRLAQLGQGAMYDVTARLTEQFSTALGARLAQTDEGPTGSPASILANGDNSADAIGGATERVRRIGSGAPTPPLDLAEFVGETPKRVAIAVVAVLLGFTLGRRRRDRASSRPYRSMERQS